MLLHKYIEKWMIYFCNVFQTPSSTDFGLRALKDIQIVTIYMSFFMQASVAMLPFDIAPQNVMGKLIAMTSIPSQLIKWK